uniref:Serpentine receptor class gamma n=1 Tax=Caenorhabditis tropicalis TaxID=1561998 RepID=A0A1I7SYV5_9PELO
MGVSTNTIVILENIMSRPAILMNIVNPIITLFYIAPYRMPFFKWFHISSVRVVRVPPLIDNQSTKTQENENGVKPAEEVIEQPVV